MSYRPQIKTNVSGAVTDLPLDAETVKGHNVEASGVASNTSTLPTTAQVKTYVDNAITDVVEIAEGKTKNYVISDVAISGYVNSSFNSTNETIALTIGSSKVRDISGNDVALSSLKVGDIVSITETSVPDRWVGSITSTTITFYKMETKIDIVNAITQNDTRPITSGAVYTGLQSKQATIDSSHKLSADLVDDTNTTHKFVSATEKTTWNNKVDSYSTDDNNHEANIENQTGGISLNSSDDDDSASIETVGGANHISATDYDNSTSSTIDQSGADIVFSQTDENGDRNSFNIFDVIGNGGIIKSEKLDIAKNLNLLDNSLIQFSSSLNNTYMNKTISLVAGQYTLSYSGASFSGGQWQVIGDGSPFLTVDVSQTSMTFTIYNTIQFKFYANVNMSGAKFMLNVGSSALAYMPYIEPKHYVHYITLYSSNNNGLYCSLTINDTNPSDYDWATFIKFLYNNGLIDHNYYLSVTGTLGSQNYCNVMGLYSPDGVVMYARTVAGQLIAIDLTGTIEFYCKTRPM